nr:hypothetical protein [Cytophagales bacterium]
MNNELAELLEKYWNGETSLEEEAKLRARIKKSHPDSTLADFFSGIEQLGKLEPTLVAKPKTNAVRAVSLWRAAAVFIGLAMFGGVINAKYQKKAQEDAYYQVMEAFSLIQTNMEKGTSELEVIGELRHLNKAHELFNINELKGQ